MFIFDEENEGERPNMAAAHVRGTHLLASIHPALGGNYVANQLCLSVCPLTSLRG